MSFTSRLRASAKRLWTKPDAEFRCNSVGSNWVVIEEKNILGFIGINTIHNVHRMVMKFYVPNNIISNYAKQKLYAIKWYNGK